MKKNLNLFFLLLFVSTGYCQEQLWHGKVREVRYHPEGNDIVIENGKMRFNRALYGGNTAFRVEAGDLPEFAMYMPGMGGNLRLALMKGSKTKWLIEAQYIKAIYRAGSMLYQIKDSILGNNELRITVLALRNAEGIVLKINSDNNIKDLQVVWIYGGASGKKFSRDGDIGADPESSFYLKAENCSDNNYQLLKNKFILTYGTGKVLTEEERYEIQTKTESQLTGEIPKNAKQITGLFPSSSLIKLIDPDSLQDAFNNKEPVLKNQCISGIFPLANKGEYILFHNTATPVVKDAVLEFNEAEQQRSILAQRIIIHTPDKYLNTLGGTLSVAADAIWEEPTYMHGAVAWRMRLPGWRGAYVADPLGWHDRARTHFDAYAKSQLTTPATSGVVMDTALNLARHLEKVGTQLFSEGYITRNPNGYVGAHHYDMNLVFIDQLLNHFNYTGDTRYVKKMWPLLKRHLAWEKKNFDADGDGLYDAYAAIWASDALQYSGGGVTHSSAYNFRTNKEMAKLAKLIGEDGSIYEEEANKILKSVNKNLWMTDKGWYAEYKDLLGNKLVHPSAGLWTIYHAIDSKMPDVFQAYQSLKYIDNYIPKIPVVAKGWDEKDLYLLSETNWQPYTWSLNNVVTSENLHTALAYWQGNRKEEAYKLWRSAMLETMYLSSAPGNFQQLSFYDAIRGELYRDFADGVGMVARTLVEGLFGIQPDALNKMLVIKPGLPKQWNNASLSTPDIQFDFKRNGLTEEYFILPKNKKQLNLKLIIPAYREIVESVKVNGKTVKWKIVDSLICVPAFQINPVYAKSYKVVIKWKGEVFEKIAYKNIYNTKQLVQINLKKATILNTFQLTQVLRNLSFTNNSVTGNLTSAGLNSFYLHIKQGAFSWFEPFDFILLEDEEIGNSPEITNETKFEKIDLSNHFNDQVTNIFKNKYLSPRPTSPTLQMPTQGIGNWAYHSTTANISDSGLRKKAGPQNQIITQDKISFSTPSAFGKKNIAFTSMWDNYPDSIVIALEGKSSYAYLLMAGSSNPMQSRLVNGAVIFNYTDGSSETLELKNPENWWPIEQDYYTDGFAFTTDAPKPIRISLKTGEELPANYKYTSIKGFTGFAIDGGAASVLVFSLDRHKQLKSMTLKAIANDVVIGLMSLTLIR